MMKKSLFFVLVVSVGFVSQVSALGKWWPFGGKEKAQPLAQSLEKLYVSLETLKSKLPTLEDID